MIKKKVIRYEKIQPEIGMRVKVVKPGRCYSQYAEWFKNNNIDVEMAARFPYGVSLEEYYGCRLRDIYFTIVAIGEHEFDNHLLCLITRDDNSEDAFVPQEYWLIGDSGLECVDEEIEYIY